MLLSCKGYKIEEFVNHCLYPAPSPAPPPSHISTVFSSSFLCAGYKIEELANNSDFEEVSYLLWYGELPNKVQKAAHTSQIAEHRMIHEKLIKVRFGCITKYSSC